MSYSIESRSMNAIYYSLMDVLSNESMIDHKSAPRGTPIHEFIPGSFTLTDPRNRLILSEARKVNYGFGVGEFCWYLRGDNDLRTMLYYNKRMSQFSDDGQTINSAYGARIFNGPNMQWELCLKELKEDPDSRRAVIHINQPHDLKKATLPDGSKDVPCTMALQFLIRDRKLELHVTMRSNDVIWGVPYDVFSFTMLQECMLLSLQRIGVPVDDLGPYHHTATSLHLYTRDLETAHSVVEEGNKGHPVPMQPITLDHIEMLAHSFEPDIRENTLQELSWLGGHEPNSVDWMVGQLFAHRKKRDEEAKRYAERQKALDELVALTEEYGGYDELKQLPEQTAEK